MTCCLSFILSLLQSDVLSQITGVRFMWENIIQSVRKVKAGDKGLGCILAHMMGLGKTFQVLCSVCYTLFPMTVGISLD